MEVLIFVMVVLILVMGIVWICNFLLKGLALFVAAILYGLAALLGRLFRLVVVGRR
jgi:hypothetical protein